MSTRASHNNSDADKCLLQFLIPVYQLHDELQRQAKKLTAVKDEISVDGFQLIKRSSNTVINLQDRNQRGINLTSLVYPLRCAERKVSGVPRIFVRNCILERFS
jgi:hypothetical protein